MKTFRKLTGVFFLLIALSFSLYATDFKVDTKISSVKWVGKKVTGQHNGTINFKSGTLEVLENKIIGGSFEMDMLTMVCSDLENETWNSKLIGHLKSEDFFSTEKHPVSKLTLNKVEKVDGNQYSFTGDLSIKGITHPITFDTNVNIEGLNLIAEGIISVDRTLYDIRYGSGKFFDSLGNNMIDDFFTLNFKLVAKTSTTETVLNN